MKIKKIIKRHHHGCFTVEDENGDWFMVRLAFKLEEVWAKNKVVYHNNRLVNKKLLNKTPPK